VLTIGVVALGVTDRTRAQAFWSRALGFTAREDGFGGWAVVLEPPGGAPGPRIALQRSLAQPQDHPHSHEEKEAEKPGPAS
jgi:catechol 2,3-dioxygenase-like lactoylglutathione lyase family enzyme